MSILHVLLKIPGGTYKQLPLCLTTTFVWNVPSKPSSALHINNTQFVKSKTGAENSHQLAFFLFFFWLRSNDFRFFLNWNFWCVNFAEKSVVYTKRKRVCRARGLFLAWQKSVSVSNWHIMQQSSTDCIATHLNTDISHVQQVKQLKASVVFLLLGLVISSQSVPVSWRTKIGVSQKVTCSKHKNWEKKSTRLVTSGFQWVTKWGARLQWPRLYIDIWNRVGSTKWPLPCWKLSQSRCR